VRRLPISDILTNRIGTIGPALAVDGHAIAGH